MASIRTNKLQGSNRSYKVYGAPGVQRSAYERPNLREVRTLAHLDTSEQGRVGQAHFP
jgi:hypothetical protein